MRSLIFYGTYAIAEALGGHGERFLADYTTNGAMQNEEILGQNTLANALIAEMEGKSKWETTVGVAWSTLLEAAKPPHGDRTFPAKQQDLRKHLERLRVSLADEGIAFDFGRRTREGVALVIYKGGAFHVHRTGHLHTMFTVMFTQLTSRIR